MAASGILVACGSSDGASMFPNVTGSDSGSTSSVGSDDSSVPNLGEGEGGTTHVDGGPVCDGCALAADATLAYCGDGLIEPALGEQCDDGNSKPGDGCSGTCQIEPGSSCPTAGQPCVLTVTQTCGNGTIDPGESCDDGNSVGGDGCSASCQVEPGWACVRPGQPCMEFDASQPAVCGDGMVEAGEQCDDANAASGDGCSSTCQIEPGYVCPMPGTLCTKDPVTLCGNGVIDSGEQCDDGNAKPGDGCSGTCRLEAGWVCATPGHPCVYQWICGNGVLDPGEQCDTGATNGNGTSGCSSTCVILPGFACADAGGAGECTKSHTCGNGIVEAGEQCDTGPNNGVGGCSSTCTLVAGWVCPAKSAQCSTVCGDGIVAGNEKCDFGAANGVGGCSTTCTIQPGFICPTLPATSAASCKATVCGDGLLQGSEECDDGNRRPYDGCSPTCTIEPKCSGGSCTALCGDGLVSAGEQCDDGNTSSGDGCSATCTIEPGFSCNNVAQPPLTTLSIPILYRDMHYCNQVGGCPNNASGATTANGAVAANGHPDFNSDAFNVGPTPRTGLVQPLLGADNEPVFLSTTGNGTQPTLSGATQYCWWYHDANCPAGTANVTNPFAKDVFLDGAGNPTSLVLTQVPGTLTYTFENVAFFPLDSLGWNDPSATTNAGWFNDPQTGTDCSELLDGAVLPGAGGQHNFSFTSELHYRFTYQANAATAPVFTFVGDDDVWAFINGHLVIDLGGMHDHLTTQVTLDGPEATALGLVDQGTYSIDLFQAERHTCRSTYGLTLADFVRITSVCVPTATCGDGKVEGAEQCDFGTANNTGAYGGCNANCTLGPSCGDGVLQNPPEQCDNGAANDTGGYGGCNANCTLGPRCGDGVVQSPEACDYGAANNTGGYGGCNANCTLGPYCGDGLVEAPEQCDDGAANNKGGYDGCNANCTLAAFCGDGVVQNPPEQCDNGASNVPAASAYGPTVCTTSCNRAPFCGDGIVEAPEVCDDGVNNGTPGSACDTQCKPKCGDGIVQAGEQCDDGTANNTGGYGGCNPDCTLAGYCGDGVVEAPQEKCDNGANNVPVSGAYGVGVCTQACTPASYCGDGVVDTAFGEQCDGTPTCTPQCQISVMPPLPK